ncbi:hypothetical protein OHA69_41495 [Streptomyces anulatus]|uniref:RNA polymerase sigma factor n=1 Tax=Streptomyces anulatus TaxID=1892 RepID=UPI002255D42B|nr:hypothetical protein [Streptomyces anulatus]MCX4524068.1 hypothetical protein [Streptomyces anulatus]
MSDRIEGQRLTAASADRLDRLFRLYNSRLVSYLARHLNNPGDLALAEDLAQETWADFARYPSRPIADLDQAFPLVARRGRQAISRHYRRVSNGTCEAPEDFTDVLISRGLPPAATAEDEALAYEDLTPRQAIVFKLKAQGLSDRKIAQRIDRSETAVWKRKHAGARRLRASLALAG